MRYSALHQVARDKTLIHVLTDKALSIPLPSKTRNEYDDDDDSTENSFSKSFSSSFSRSYPKVERGPNFNTRTGRSVYLSTLVPQVSRLVAKLAKEPYPLFRNTVAMSHL
ncbi:hypothetical protein FVE85_8718 [Porphyridium purpureum]|uniref:Uncharacterized protein n=1 Tax=Porphyridium purpureum TaxID=35688 RepID=A0A5J4YR53_PORPP|nr:hypothetical protein FVE85_8718 [Porphyridium purpureum]|eukprot:POR1546..scf296_7